MQLNSNSCQFPIEAFSQYFEATNSIAWTLVTFFAIAFRFAEGCLRRDVLWRSGHVRHEKSSFIYDSAADRANDLSTGSIASVAGPRRPFSLRNKGTSTSGTYPLLLAESSERLAFHFRFSFACPSHRALWHGVLQDVFYFDPVKGVDVFCANVRYTGTTPSSPR